MSLRILKKIGYSFYLAGYNTVDHDGVEHAGYLAFMGLLAMFPFLIILVAVAGVLGNNLVSADVLAEFTRHLPENVVSAIQPRILEITTGPSQSLLTIAILGALWTSSSGVEGLRTILNRAYRVHTPPNYFLRRTLSILQVIIFSSALAIALGLFLGLPALLNYLQSVVAFDISEIIVPIAKLNYIVATLLLFFGISSIFYFIPNVKQTWLSVFPGAAVVVIGWFAAVKGLGFYLSHFTQFSVVYGSLGGIIATLFFFYILSLILIYGAELSYLIKRATGEKIEEKEKA